MSRAGAIALLPCIVIAATGTEQKEEKLFGRHVPPLSAALDFARFSKPGCTQGGSAIDVGARGGWETAEILSADFHAIAVECQPDEYVRLHERWRLNENVTLLNFCASNEGPGIRTLYNAEGATTLERGTLNHRGERLRHKAAKRKSDPVIAMPLDKLIWQAMSNSDGLEPASNIVHPICVIKLDIQGHEVVALKGLKETLRRYKPIIYFEFEWRFSMNHLTKGFIEGLGLGYECNPNDKARWTTGSSAKLIASLPPMPCFSGACDVICSADRSREQMVAFMRDWVASNNGSHARIRPELRNGLEHEFTHKEVPPPPPSLEAA